VIFFKDNISYMKQMEKYYFKNKIEFIQLANRPHILEICEHLNSCEFASGVWAFMGHGLRECT
jgi:hypothetical protein